LIESLCYAYMSLFEGLYGCTTPKSKMVAGGRKDLADQKDTGRPVEREHMLYEVGFCQTLVIRLMKRGFSIFEVAEHLGVGTRTILALG
jgi:hypothetical protein